MPDIAIFGAATCVAALMLITSMRALTWHKVSTSLTSLLLLLVLFVTWSLLARSGPISLEQWILLVLCGLVGLVVGLVRGQTVPMRYEAREGGVLCRRGALLPFCWAVTAVIMITLSTIPGLRAPAWAGVLPPTLVFSATAFTASTLTVFSRVGSLRREQPPQPEQGQVAH
ncbi:MAG TPA: hypothetical protein VH599_14820 [Ktedonobacterales bacterium]|jgi:hypothetical protein